MSHFFLSFFCFGFFHIAVSCVRYKLGVVQNVSACSFHMCDCGVKFVHATSMHFSFGPFEQSDEEQKEKKISTNYFQICPATSESYNSLIGTMMSSAT